jgi:WD40 repeat protein
LMMKPGDFGTVPITPRNLEESDLYQLITSEDSHARMPNNGGRLAEPDIRTVAKWILQGAKFDGQNSSAPLRDQIPRDLPHPPAPTTYPAAIPILAMSFTGNGSQLLVAGYHELLVWDPTSATLVARIGNIAQRTFGLVFSPDNNWLAAAGGSPGVSGEVRLIPWGQQTKSGSDGKVLATSEDVFFAVAFAPNGKQLAAAAADGSVRVFDIPSGTERLKINNHADWVTDIRFSPDSKLIATASRDKTAKVFNPQSGQLLATYSRHKLPVRAVTFATDGKSIISAAGLQIHIWNLQDSNLVGEMPGCKDEVSALLACGDNVVAASADRSARLFKFKDRTIVHALKHPASVMSLACHEPTHRLSTGCFDGTVTVWDLEKGTMLKQFLGFPMATKPNKPK